MRIYITKFFIFLGFLLAAVTVAGQVYYPVVAKITQTPPYPVYLADYSNPLQTSLSIQVQQNDRTLASQPFKVRIHIEGQGFTIRSTENVVGEIPLELQYGQVYTLSPAEVATYFHRYNLQVSEQQYMQPFSEGTVRFGVQIHDFVTGRALSGIQWAEPVWVTLNEPPVWIQPRDTSVVQPFTAWTANAVTPLVFQWSPRHTNVSNVEYELSLTELPTGVFGMGNVQNYYLAQPPFYTTRTTATTWVYDATCPPLIEGRAYAYRVRAIAKKGNEDIGLFKNNGYSEVRSFAYGEPMQAPVPPVIVSLYRDDFRNISTLEWTGQERHTAYILAWRVRGSGTGWMTERTLPQAENHVQQYPFHQLERNKNYEIRVGSEDRYGQQAYSAPVNLDSIPYSGPEKISLIGNVYWAFYAGEDEATSATAEILTPMSGGREITRQSYLSGETGPGRYPLAGATVTLFAANSAYVTESSIDTEEIIPIHTVSTAGNGEFQFKATPVLWGAEHLYLLITHPDKAFSRVVRPLPLKSLTSLGIITLGADSYRYSPRLTVNPAYLEVLRRDGFEELGLYRLTSLRQAHAYLAHEGNTSERTQITYNGQTYTKVSDFRNTGVSGGLFGNASYNDQYILRAKQSGRREVIFPITGLPDTSGTGYTQVTDYFEYTPPTARISGYVRKGYSLVANAAVQLNGQTVRSNAGGYFVFDIGPEVAQGTPLTVKAMDPTFVHNYATATWNFTGDQEFNLFLGSSGHYIESQILDGRGKPLPGVTVQYQDTYVKTDANGWFSLVHYGAQNNQGVTLKMSGYEDRQIPLSQLTHRTLELGTRRQNIFVPVLISLNRPSFLAQVRNPAVDGKFYDQYFQKPGYECTAVFTGDPITLERSFSYRIIVVKEPETPGSGLSAFLETAEYLSATLDIDGVPFTVPEGEAYLDGETLKGRGGYAAKAPDLKIQVKVRNVAGKPLMVEKSMTLTIPENTLPGDEVTFVVALTPAVQFYGMVRDSTAFFRTGAKPLPDPAPHVTISVTGTDPVESAENGTFSMLIPVKRENLFELSRTGYNKTKVYLTDSVIAQYPTANNPRTFYVIKRDSTLPEFVTLMGFKVEIDKIERNPNPVPMTQNGQAMLRDPGARTFFLSGKILADAEETENFLGAYIPDENTRLRFAQLPVQQDEDDPENALTLYPSANLLEVQTGMKVFGYAPVNLKGQSYIELRVSEEDDKKGIIGGYNLTLTQNYIAGMSFQGVQLEEGGEENENVPKKFVKVFSSTDFGDSPEKFRLVFRNAVPGADLAKEGIDTTGRYYKAPFASIGGFYSPFNVLLDHTNAELNEDGLFLEGYFTFPKIWKFRSQGPLAIKKLEINKDFNLENLTLGKSDTTKKEFIKFAVGNKWIMYINTLQVYNNFQGYGIGGTFNMDQTNYVNIESLGFSVVNGSVYPNVVLTTPDSGFVFKSIKFTTLTGKSVSFTGNAEEGSYELKAAFKMEYSAGATSNATLKKIAAKVFPMTVNDFLWSTSGKFLIAISPGNPIEIGPLKVNIRRLVYTKGGAATKSQINELLALSEEEVSAFYASKIFTDANKFTEGAADTLASDYAFVAQLANEVAGLDPAAKWGFGFSGGVGIDNLRGMSFDSHLSFVLGDFGNGTEFDLNEIFMKLETAAFYASGYIKIENSDTKVGFEGEVKVKAVKLELEAAFKFYQLYGSNGQKTGIELGASLLVKANIIMGPVTWTSLGGGFDLNTADQKYLFFLQGSAVVTGTPPETVELKNILLSVSFDLKKCDGAPVVKGSMDLFVKGEKLCETSIELDFCEVRVIVYLKCEKEYLKDVTFTAEGVILASKNEGFFGGINVNLRMGLLGMNQNTNAFFGLGGNYKTYSHFAMNDARVKGFTAKIPQYLRLNDGTFSGIYLEFGQDKSFSSSGNVIIASYSASFSLKYLVTFGVRFSDGNLRITGNVAAAAHVMGEIPGIVSITGAASANLSLEGGYQNSTGWYFSARASVSLQIYNGGGAGISCNKLDIHWVNKDTGIDYPCGWCCFSWKRPFGKVRWCDLYVPVPASWKFKVCINGSVWVSYYQRGSNSGWKYGF